MQDFMNQVDQQLTSDCAEHAVQSVAIGWILAGFAVALLQLI